MKITQVQFPDERVGLELDDGKSYRYFYNGDSYGKNVEFPRDSHGMILNLKRLREVSIDHAMMAASQEYS